jgi:hypothetical protein
MLQFGQHLRSLRLNSGVSLTMRVEFHGDKKPSNCRSEPIASNSIRLHILGHYDPVVSLFCFCLLGRDLGVGSAETDEPESERCGDRNAKFTELKSP